MQTPATLALHPSGEAWVVTLTYTRGLFDSVRIMRQADAIIEVKVEQPNELRIVFDPTQRLEAMFAVTGVQTLIFSGVTSDDEKLAELIQLALEKHREPLDSTQ